MKLFLIYELHNESKLTNAYENCFKGIQPNAMKLPTNFSNIYASSKAQS